MRLLIEGGADANPRNEEGWVSVHLASSMEKTDTARLLLEGGAIANAHWQDEEGWTSFQMASANGNKEVAQMMLGTSGHGI